MRSISTVQINWQTLTLTIPFLIPFIRSGCAELSFGDGGCASAYAYSHSRGLYAGISLEGSVIFSRTDVNHRFYGRHVTPTELLQGIVPSPRAARPLYDALQTALSAVMQPTYGQAPLSMSVISRDSTSTVHTSASASYPTMIENWNIALLECITINQYSALQHYIFQTCDGQISTDAIL